MSNGKARKRSTDSVEQALIEWGAFMQESHDAKGFVGERDFITDSVYGRIQAGQSGDPTLASVMSLEASGNSTSYRVDMHLRGYARRITREWYVVAWARFVGRPVVVEKKFARIHDTIQIARYCYQPFSLRVEMPARWAWSGMLTWDEVAECTGIPKRTAELMLSLVKRELGMDIRMDEYTRRGRNIPDGDASPAERRAVDAARRQREAQRELEAEEYDRVA